jgi:hypothetical protein
VRNDLPAQKHSSLFGLFNQAYQVDPLPGRILKAIQEGVSLKESIVVEGAEKDGQVLYRGKCYVPEGDELRL